MAYISRRAFPLWENLRYLLFLRTVRSKFPFQNCIMKRGDNVPVREMLLLIVAGGGLLMDLLQEKVDNRLICLGFGFGFILALMSHSISGILNFFFGILFPLFSLLPLFYFHMIGGGDIKLLSALGSILGCPKTIGLLILSFLTGAILSIAFLIFCGNLKERISYFISYFSGYRTKRVRENYRKKGPRPENYHFTVPIFTGIILFVGGCY